MAYFITGGTGFIGRFLVANLRERGEPVYALVRPGSRDKLDALRKHLGASDRQLIAVVGDLGKKNLGISRTDAQRLVGRVDHFFHVAATASAHEALSRGASRYERSS
jgi:thioester reductase-like protein